jgi:hypothetical protein
MLSQDTRSQINDAKKFLWVTQLNWGSQPSVYEGGVKVLLPYSCRCTAIKADSTATCCSRLHGSMATSDPYKYPATIPVENDEVSRMLLKPCRWQ